MKTKKLIVETIEIENENETIFIFSERGSNPTSTKLADNTWLIEYNEGHIAPKIIKIVKD